MKKYHRRNRICPEHLKSQCIIMKGLQCRFCQQVWTVWRHGDTASACIMYARTEISSAGVMSSVIESHPPLSP